MVNGELTKVQTVSVELDQRTMDLEVASRPIWNVFGLAVDSTTQTSGK